MSNATGPSRDRRHRRARRRRQEHRRAALAERLGFRYLDTGAMYRALTWLALQRGVALDLADELGGARARASGRVRRGRARLHRRHRRHRGDPPPRDRPARPRRRAAPAGARGDARAPAALGEEGDVVIEGRDIGTVVAPGRAGEGLPRRRPGRPRGAPARRAARDRRRRARDRPAPPRRARRAQHAPGRRTRSEIDTTTSRSTRSSTRIDALVAHAPDGMKQSDAVWAAGRLTIGTLVRLLVAAAATTASTASRAGRRSCSRSTTSTGSTRRSFGALSPRTIYFLAKVEAHRVPGLGAADPQLRHDLGAPRRVRPRGCAR